jgi:hypothetical protein
MYGYTLSLLNRNKQADGHLLGVKLGRICIAKNISVSKAAVDAGVSRQTIYNWFCGVNRPTGQLENVVEKLIARYSK